MRKLVTATAFVFAVVAGAVIADDKDKDKDKLPDISTIMKKVHGKTGLKGKVKDAMAAGEIDWDALAKQTKEYKKFAEALGKNDPPKGEKEDWKKLTKEFTDYSKKLDEAVGKKDKDAATKAFKFLSDAKTCKTCHDAHKG